MKLMLRLELWGLMGLEILGIGGRFCLSTPSGESWS